ncbi:hypothetical protein [Arsenicicoccus dermatophilus]|uniref:hypothetical protein n=1 Tax=Arsenicicoccus dermatophilus TaxID=1076331 RepID=UPI001F4C6BA5|nr:hypothetical protein [Arsenicicoccus dermatophilus]MCH8613446.1 hypothetical protein [Arsenicicoccus dermatophilus]
MSELLAIDPGSEQSGWVIIDTRTRRPLHHGKDTNQKILAIIRSYANTPPEQRAGVWIEKIGRMAGTAGESIFETCVWTGRFMHEAERLGLLVERVKRVPIKVHLRVGQKGTDTDVRRALVDRFAPGEPRHGKGTKDEPGWFYGFAADAWQAYALAVYASDTLEPPETAPPPDEHGQVA